MSSITGAAALLLGALLAFPCAAADDGHSGDKAGPKEEKRAEQRPSSSDKPARTGDDLESCKRDADGMKGPERSRFMTDCLRERR